MIIQDSIQACIKFKIEIENRRRDSINTEKRKEDLKNSIKITSYYITEPNSAGGVSVYFYYKNLSNKIIKYLTWVGYPINKVNDPVSCTIRDYSTYRGKDQVL